MLRFICRRVVFLCSFLNLDPTEPFVVVFFVLVLAMMMITHSRHDIFHYRFPPKLRARHELSYTFGRPCVDFLHLSEHLVVVNDDIPQLCVCVCVCVCDVPDDECGHTAERLRCIRPESLAPDLPK